MDNTPGLLLFVKLTIASMVSLVIASEPWTPGQSGLPMADRTSQFGYSVDQHDGPPSSPDVQGTVQGDINRHHLSRVKHCCRSGVN